MSSQPTVPPARWRFGQFELDAASRELRKNGLRIRLQEQPARILEALLARPGELVTREELRDHLWPADTFVDFERSLNAAVAKLRQALADSAEQPLYVETVSRRGYRFIAPVTVEPLEEERAVPPSIATAVEAPRPQGSRRTGLWVWPAAGLVLLGLAAGISRIGSSGPTDAAPASRFVVPPPDGTRIHPMSAIAPDGSRMAFVAVESSGQRSLWLRHLASETAVRLDNAGAAVLPFFSADSQQIGFFADGKLKTIAVAGGAPQTVCNVEQPAGGTWSRDNVILFSQSGRLYRVSAGGGAATELARPATAAGERNVDTWPQFLPDGRRFIVSTANHNGHINTIRTEIYLGSLDASQRKLLVESRSRAAYARSGHLLYRRDEALVAQKLDLRRGELIGEAHIVAQGLNPASAGIEVDVTAGLPVGVVPAPFSVSDNGVLVYHSNPPLERQLVWVNREGERLGVAGELRDYMQIVLSPDEQWAALGIRERGSRRHWNIWLLRVQTNVLSRLTFGEGRDADPAWGPDSDRIVYGAYRADEGEKIDLMETTLGERAAKRIFSDGHANKPEAWSPDGRCLLFRRNEQSVLCLPMTGDGKPETILQTPYFLGGFRFSPDGRWLSYVSAESGRAEIYVSSYPAMTASRQISTAGGWAPAWRKDGKELFYMDARGDVMSVDVTMGPKLETGAPRLLFHTKTRNPNMPQFAVTDNGRKFLVIEAPPRQAVDERMVVVTGWNTSLRR
jgi:Tol biopolymer transport system component/DNA-binding winged helix-turn-helix (wHTH) protein